MGKLSSSEREKKVRKKSGRKITLAVEREVQYVYTHIPSVHSHSIA